MVEGEDEGGAAMDVASGGARQFGCFSAVDDDEAAARVAVSLQAEGDKASASCKKKSS